MKSPSDCYASLTTPYESDLQAGDVPHAAYPRPQMRRDSYMSLNGAWTFTVRRGRRTAYEGKITVPFPPESRLSGVEMQIDKRDVMTYKRTFTLPPDFMRDRVILHVGACDQYARVYINGTAVGEEHIGGYLPIELDITNALCAGENTLRIEARDPLCHDLPYGKQTNRRGGMWYTKVSGIWQSVWLESVPEDYIRRLRITPDLQGVTVEVEGGCREKLLRLGDREYPFSGDRVRVDVENPHLWSPDDPYLYEFTLTAGEDTVASYFGLRTVTMERHGSVPCICLNGKPIFCHGLLDQGYFPDGIFLPASPRGYTEDVLLAKACGFNMLRKHIKLEPEQFYYDCDRLGVLVFQDMVNSGRYSFLLDTSLPTVGLKRSLPRHASRRRREAFESACRDTLAHLYNHPSVVYYTIFNEGWGQYPARGVYETCRALDPTRVYDTASGWFRVKHTDVESEHVYFKPVRLRISEKKPTVLSEFGGYAHRVEGHVFNLKKTYGYKKFADQKAFEDALVDLYENEIIPAAREGLCGAVLTQLSDVEDEVNGLITYDRRVVKADSARMQKVASRLQTAFLQGAAGSDPAHEPPTAEYPR